MNRFTTFDCICGNWEDEEMQELLGIGEFDGCDANGTPLSELYRVEVVGNVWNEKIEYE